MTLDEDRAELERLSLTWQNVPAVEQEEMLTALGKMLDYLDPTEEAELQLRLDTAHLLRQIEAAIGRAPSVSV